MSDDRFPVRQSSTDEVLCARCAYFQRVHVEVATPGTLEVPAAWRAKDGDCSILDVRSPRRVSATEACDGFLDAGDSDPNE